MERTYEEQRHVWEDFMQHQKFEHQLLDRKINWLLTTQALLFAAFGVSLQAESLNAAGEEFRNVVPWVGIGTAIVAATGSLAIIRSKYIWWRKYRRLYHQSTDFRLPAPLEGLALHWGAQTRNTLWTLIPDLFLPLIFTVAWVYLN